MIFGEDVICGILYVVFCKYLIINQTPYHIPHTKFNIFTKGTGYFAFNFPINNKKRL
jgi:hypothetical protein